MDEDIEQWKMQKLSNFGGRAILSEDEIGDRLGFDAFSMRGGTNTAWYIKGKESGIVRFRGNIAAALGFERLVVVVSKVMYGTRYFVFA